MLELEESRLDPSGSLDPLGSHIGFIATCDPLGSHTGPMTMCESELDESAYADHTSSGLAILAQSEPILDET
eukprot:4450245-Karenia_brevis.AAC.1